MLRSLLPQLTAALLRPSCRCCAAPSQAAGLPKAARSAGRQRGVGSAAAAGASPAELAAAAAELRAASLDSGEDGEEEDDADGNWWFDTQRGPRALALRGGVMLEPSMAERFACSSNSTVKSASFVKSSVSVADCPPPVLPEFAFIGRSNVGKSSLVNCLAQRKSLALVSKTPGKTQTINHFLMESGTGPWHLVDLPGYGFARAPGELKAGWTSFTMEYFLKRESLVSVMLLVDGTLPPQEADLEVADWLGEHEVPFSVVFTKVDKRRKLRPGVRTRAADNVRAFQGALAAGWKELPPSLMTSANSGAGRQALLNHIAALRTLHRDKVSRLKLTPLAKPSAGRLRAASEARALADADAAPFALPSSAEADEAAAAAWRGGDEDDVAPPLGMHNARAPGEAPPPPPKQPRRTAGKRQQRGLARRRPARRPACARP
jgi:GTP-binding protein